MTQELADSIKRLRSQYAKHKELGAQEEMDTINALVDLVGEMEAALQKSSPKGKFTDDFNKGYVEGYHDASHIFTTKAAPIAALKEEV